MIIGNQQVVIAAYIITCIPQCRALGLLIAKYNNNVESHIILIQLRREYPCNFILVIPNTMVESGLHLVTYLTY